MGDVPVTEVIEPEPVAEIVIDPAPLVTEIFDPGVIVTVTGFVNPAPFVSAVIVPSSPPKQVTFVPVAVGVKTVVDAFTTLV